MSSNIYIGLMTGTSLDGVDTVICEFDYEREVFKIKELFFRTFKYPQEIRSKISEIISGAMPIRDVSQLNFALSKIYAQSVNLAMNESGINKDKIKAIGMHGQTIWHEPIESDFCGIDIASTLQLGNISALRAFTGIPVIGDFRSADIALGGQGAPLVPIFDYHFLRSKSKNVIALNIGGISNITYLPINCSIENILAFDTGPGNMLIDLATKKYFDKDFDYDGQIARTGTTDIELLNKLMSIEFIGKRAPKSTGRELFNVGIIIDYFGTSTNPADVINTLTNFTAKSIAFNINSLSLPVDSVFVSGGGAHNSFMIELLNEYLPNIEIMPTNKIGIGVDSKEANCFAFLAYLNDLGLPGNVISATGASSEAVLGCKSY